MINLDLDLNSSFNCDCLNNSVSDWSRDTVECNSNSHNLQKKLNFARRDFQAKLWDTQQRIYARSKNAR